MRIKINVYGNLNLIATLKKLGVSLIHSPDAQMVMATFDAGQAHLYECTKKILARRVANTLQRQA